MKNLIIGIGLFCGVSGYAMQPNVGDQNQGPDSNTLEYADIKKIFDEALESYVPIFTPKQLKRIVALPDSYFDITTRSKKIKSSAVIMYATCDNDFEEFRHKLDIMDGRQHRVYGIFKPDMRAKPRQKKHIKNKMLESDTHSLQYLIQAAVCAERMQE